MGIDGAGAGASNRNGLPLSKPYRYRSRLAGPPMDIRAMRAIVLRGLDRLIAEDEDIPNCADCHVELCDDHRNQLAEAEEYRQARALLAAGETT